MNVINISFDYMLKLLRNGVKYVYEVSNKEKDRGFCSCRNGVVEEFLKNTLIIRFELILNNNGI